VPLVPDVPLEDSPLEPLVPDVPLVPEVPLVPDVPLEDSPLEPLVPDVPLVPEVPLVPLVPEVPLEPVTTASRTVGACCGGWYRAPAQTARPPAKRTAPTVRPAVALDDRWGGVAVCSVDGGFVRSVISRSPVRIG
jgi:hypothetical protein